MEASWLKLIHLLSETLEAVGVWRWDINWFICSYLHTPHALATRFSHSSSSSNKIATFCWIPFQIELTGRWLQVFVFNGFLQCFELRAPKSLANLCVVAVCPLHLRKKKEKKNAFMEIFIIWTRLGRHTARRESLQRRQQCQTWSTTLIRTEISQQLPVGLPWNFVPTFMVSRDWILRCLYF